ncbi:unnamed protein product [Caenorhabditis auriculariae]|uniref:Follistatin-like domain-containing protein n=1 Tax=Caenorhabditis auriculariae TaxID=2777116 RepID=A0A8S1H8J8_9PELO|nr:unnamed protein product [Caenorhabditis auriculariae]
MLIRYLVTVILFGAASSIDLDSITCDMIQCRKGFKCVMVREVPECHQEGSSEETGSSGPKLTCASVRCPGGFKCVNTAQGPICSKPEKHTKQTCVNLDCPRGYKCKIVQDSWDRRFRRVPTCVRSRAAPPAESDVQTRPEPRAPADEPGNTHEPITGDPCADHKCHAPEYYTCKVIDGTPQCLAINPCSPNRCPEKTYCHARESGEGARCLPVNPCGNRTCPANSQCYNYNSQDNIAKKMDEGAYKCIGDPPCVGGDTCIEIEGADYHCENINGTSQCVLDPKCTVHACDPETGHCVEGDGKSLFEFGYCDEVNPCAKKKCENGTETECHNYISKAYCTTANVCDPSKNNSCPADRVCKKIDSGSYRCLKVDACSEKHCDYSRVCKVVDNNAVCAQKTPCDDDPCPAGQICQLTSSGSEFDCIAVDPCADHKCHAPEYYTCKVIDGTPQCLAINPCSPNRCPEKTYCHARESGEGARCLPVNPCGNRTCPANSQCYNYNSVAWCTTACDCDPSNPKFCPAGQHCQKMDEGAYKCIGENPCDKAPCGAGFDCSVVDGKASCIKIDPCFPGPCISHRCETTSSGSPKCIEDPPCVGGDTCIEIEGADYHCENINGTSQCVLDPKCTVHACDPETGHCVEGDGKSLFEFGYCDEVNPCAKKKCENGTETECHNYISKAYCTTANVCDPSKNNSCPADRVCKKIDSGSYRCLKVDACSEKHCDYSRVCKVVDNNAVCAQKTPCDDDPCPAGQTCQLTSSGSEFDCIAGKMKDGY